MMNAAQDNLNQAPLGLKTGAAQVHGRQLGDAGAALSALVDGEIDEAELDALLLAYDEQTDTRASWHSYQVIGDVLRGTPAASAVAPQVFVAGIQARLQAESRVQPQPEAFNVSGHVRSAAANDAVFRWKLVAGVASLAAVMAVSWSVLSGAPTGAGGGTGAGAQLALMQPAAVSVGSAPAAVVVNTPQGPVIRDARLEALLTEHRQYGAMSALQMPAGFLRDATYDTAPQR